MRPIFVILVIFISFPIVAQPAFVNYGNITFERKINSYAILPLFMKEAFKKDETQIFSIMQQIREDKSIKQFQIDNFELTFDKTKSLYQPIIEENSNTPYYLLIAYKNVVYSDFEKRQAMTEKQVYEKQVFIQDSLSPINWKITEELREIAGYQCRRANAIIADSIYVVAFYADDIPTSGGPESFHGLPGMILGIALPHLHITIFATSVKPLDSTPEKLKMPKPKKKTIPFSHKEFMAMLTKDLGQYFALQSSWERKFLRL